MPPFLLALLGVLWRFKVDLITAAVVILAVAFATGFDQYLIAAAVIASYLLGHGAGAGSK